MKVINLSNNYIIGDQIHIADNPLKKMVGLLSRKNLDYGEGLLIKNTNSIHSIGMRFNFDAVYLDKEYNVVKTIEKIKPWRIMPVVFNAKHVLELPAGMVEKAQIRVNNRLEFQE